MSDIPKEAAKQPKSFSDSLQELKDKLAADLKELEARKEVIEADLKRTRKQLKDLEKVELQ